MTKRAQAKTDLEEIFISSLSTLKSNLLIGDCSIKTQGLLNIAHDSLRMIEKLGFDKSEQLYFSDEKTP